VVWGQGNTFKKMAEWPHTNKCVTNSGKILHATFYLNAFYPARRYLYFHLQRAINSSRGLSDNCTYNAIFK